MIVQSTQGPNGATYNIVAITSRHGSTEYAISRSGGVTPAGEPLLPQHCGTYLTAAIAIDMTADLIRVASHIYALAVTHAQRKRVRLAAAQ